MARNRDIESTINGIGDQVRERARHYVDVAGDHTDSLMERGRDMRRRFGRHKYDYARRLSHAAEDVADEANYQYRRLRRHVTRHPVATAAIVAGTIGAFLLLRRAFRSDDED